MNKGNNVIINDELKNLLDIIGFKIFYDVSTLYTFEYNSHFININRTIEGGQMYNYFYVDFECQFDSRDIKIFISHLKKVFNAELRKHKIGKLINDN